MRVVVVAEYYPRPAHPGLGFWAHRQARAVMELGVEVRVLVLERPLPSLAVVRALGPTGDGPDTRPLREWASGVWHPPRDTVLDGVPVRYVRFVSPPRPLTYATWGRWASRPLARALDELHRAWPFQLVHAHYAVPSGDAVLRWMRRKRRLPLAISVHGGDLSYTAPRSERGRRVVTEAFQSADALIANSELTRAGVEELGGPAERIHIVHPGADPPAREQEHHRDPTLVTVAHLEAHKAQGDVIGAIAALRSRQPHLRYVMIGGGPDRAELERLADSLGVAERVRFTGRLSHAEALAELGRCHLHVMPSRHDAFGVAHLEAMAAGVPTIGSLGTGAEDIARAGEGIVLVPPGEVGALAETIDELLGDERRRSRLAAAARKTVSESFSWERNGRQTLAIYQALAG